MTTWGFLIDYASPMPLFSHHTQRFLGVLTLAFACFGASAVAQAQTWSAPQFVAKGEAVAVDTNGNGTIAVLFWVNGPGLWGTVQQRGVWSSPVQLSKAVSVGSVKVAPDGNVLAAFANQAAFFHNGKWASPVTLATNQASSLAIGFDGSSEATVVWEQRSSSSCSLVGVTGNAMSGFGSSQSLGGTCLGWLQFAETSNGAAIAVEGATTLEVAPIVATIRGANGVWAASAQIAGPYYGRQHPEVGLAENGNAVVVWRARTYGEYAVVENGRWSAPALLPEGTGSTYPQVAVDGVGNAVAVYLGKVAYRQAGGPFETPVMINEAGGVFASPAGTFVLDANPVAIRLPGSSVWNANGPAPGALAIAPRQAVDAITTMPNPADVSSAFISLSTVSVP